MGKVKGASGGTQQGVPPLADPDETEQPKRPQLIPTEAGYVLFNDGSNRVFSGDYSGDYSDPKNPVEAERAVWCDSRWGSETPSVFHLTGVEFTKEQAVCLREAWKLNRDAFVLDRQKGPQGAYCIEKMDPSVYKTYLNDKKYESYRECLKEDQIDKLNEILTIEEPSKLGDLAFLAVAFGIAAPLGTMLLQGAWSLIKKGWSNRKGGPKDPPAPPVSGGGSKVPVLVDSPAKAPAGDSKFSALDAAYDPDAVYAPQVKPIIVKDVANQFAEKLGLIAAGVLGLILLRFGGPAAVMGLEGAAAGGAFMLSPGSNGGQGSMSGAGPIA